MPWREPLASDWHERVKELEHELRQADKGGQPQPGLTARLRRLSAMSFGASEQAKFNRVARLAVSQSKLLPGFRPVKALIASNRTASLFANDLQTAGISRGLLLEAVDAGFNNVAPLAFGKSATHAEKFDVIILMLDIDAFYEHIPLLDAQSEQQAFDRATDYLSRLSLGLKERFSCPVVIATILERPDHVISSIERATPGSRARLIAHINAFIYAEGAARECIVWDLAAVAARVGSAAWFDPIRLHLAKLMFAAELGPFFADQLCRVLCALFGKSARALVLDLDNTLWGGVIADDRIDGLQIGQGSPQGEAFLLFQELVLQLRQRGVALAVCSKNLEDIAREPFRQHPDMLIKESDIAVFVADFQDKATNVAAVAKALDLGLESLVFVDDNPAERERVRSELPSVHVPEMGNDPAQYARILTEAGYFEHLPLTTEDLKRNDGYAARGLALQARASIGNFEEYLTSLEMRIDIKPFDSVGRARISQLINKSNQFNLTTIRYNELDVDRIERDRSKLAFQVRLTDRFTDHGMISVVIVNKNPDMWEIDTWVMSCRVLERGVEQAIMNRIFELAADENMAIVKGMYRPTDRNALVKDFFNAMGFRLSSTARDECQTYELPVNQFRPFKVYVKEMSAKELVSTG
jgi:FkbH-like protein